MINTKMRFKISTDKNIHGWICILVCTHIRTNYICVYIYIYIYIYTCMYVYLVLTLDTTLAGICMQVACLSRVVRPDNNSSILLIYIVGFWCHHLSFFSFVILGSGRVVFRNFSCSRTKIRRSLFSIRWVLQPSYRVGAFWRQEYQPFVD